MAAPRYVGFASTRTACDAASVEVNAGLEVTAMALTTDVLTLPDLMVGGESSTQLKAYQVVVYVMCM